MVPSEVFILLAAIQIILSTYIYLANPTNKVNITNAVLYVLSAYFSFIEYEISKQTTGEDIYYWANLHSITISLILYCGLIYAWLFAFPLSKNAILEKKWVIALLAFLSLLPLKMCYSFTDRHPLLGGICFLTDNGWRYQRIHTDSFFILFSAWILLILVCYPCCFYIAYQKEKNPSYQSWKKILFITSIIAPFLVFHTFVIKSTDASHNSSSFTAGIYIFLLVSLLTHIFSNFKLFEVSHATAFDNILNSMSNLVIITDSNFKITYYNTAFRRLFVSLKKEHIEGMNLLDLKNAFIKSDVDNVPQIISAINSLELQGRFEHNITLTVDDRVYHYLFIVSPIYHKKQIKTGFSFVGIDLTHLKESEIQFRKYAEQLEKSNRELERFAYIASHDLKTPLRNVISFLSLIKRKAKKMEHEPEEYLNFAITNAKNMYTLIEDILEFSRTRNSSEEQFEMVDLNRLIVLVRQNLSQQIEEKNIIIESDTLPTIQANPTRILQLFQNLVENGLKYNKSEFPTVKITYTATSDGAYKFFICDNGIGILPEYQDTIFELFKRLHTQSEYPGSGLGLAISKKIAEQYGGDITLESNPPNGSIFMVTLRDITAPNHLYHQNSRMAKQLNN